MCRLELMWGHIHFLLSEFYFSYGIKPIQSEDSSGKYMAKNSYSKSEDRGDVLQLA